MTSDTLRLTTQEVGEKIGTSGRTVRRMIERYDLPAKKVNGKWVVEEELITTLNTILELKDTHGDNTIRRTIGTSSGQPRHDEEVQKPDTTDQEHYAAWHDSPLDIKAEIKTAVTIAIKENNELSEKYALACRHIGSLEEQVKNLTGLTESQTKQLSILPSPDYLQAILTKNVTAQVGHEVVKTMIQQRFEVNLIRRAFFKLRTILLGLRLV